MGNKKVNVLEYIEDEKKRGYTFSKRKRGLLKKAIELSTMCDKYISISIFDSSK